MYNGFLTGYPYMQLPQQAPAPVMTPPTIHADIIQIDTEDEGWNMNVAPGTSKMMMLRDESAIFIKSAYTDKQPTMDIYRKEAQRSVPGPSDYVTKEELAAALEAVRVKRTSRTEAAAE